MELHLALRNIIKTEGIGILKQLRLVNILDDFNAYQSVPASKYVLRAIIADGYMTKLLNIGTWDNTAESLSTKFATTTGFKTEIVNCIFRAIAIALGWNTLDTVNDNLVVEENQDSDDLINQLSLGLAELKTKSAEFKDKYAEKAEDYLNSVLKFDADDLKRLSVSLFAHITYNPRFNSFDINIENKGQASENVWLDFLIVIKSTKGRILYQNSSWWASATFSEGYGVSGETVKSNSFKKVGAIGEIIVRLSINGD